MNKLIYHSIIDAEQYCSFHLLVYKIVVLDPVILFVHESHF